MSFVLVETRELAAAPQAAGKIQARFNLSGWGLSRRPLEHGLGFALALSLNVVAVYLLVTLNASSAKLPVQDAAMVVTSISDERRPAQARNAESASRTDATPHSSDTADQANVREWSLTSIPVDGPQANAMAPPLPSPWSSIQPTQGRVSARAAATENVDAKLAPVGAAPPDGTAAPTPPSLKALEGTLRARFPDAKGAAAVQVLVGPEGSVIEAYILQSDLTGSVRAEILRLIRATKFPTNDQYSYQVVAKIQLGTN